ncbi:DUF4286 family protein [Novosphingobium rosa]|uniref:DUF4286 family protein n=1 Tax=Novosphingobium rosa TaxID=76978 RepID=UPI0008338930|nr:DUF4286 family protein [Novosphingobium rosa]
MAQHKLLVLANPVDGRDDDFNHWYDTVHLPDVLKVPGVTGAERFRLSEGGQWRYLAIYELECEDPAAVSAELMSRAGTPLMTMTDAFDLSTFFMATASTITPFCPA